MTATCLDWQSVGYSTWFVGDSETGFADTTRLVGCVDLLIACCIFAHPTDLLAKVLSLIKRVLPPTANLERAVPLPGRLALPLLVHLDRCIALRKTFGTAFGCSQNIE